MRSVQKVIARRLARILPTAKPGDEVVTRAELAEILDARDRKAAQSLYRDVVQS